MLQAFTRLASFASLLCLPAVVLCQPGPAGGPPNRPADVIGLHITRLYPYEEIANISRGALLGFDELGRLSVTDTGAYIVLNDSIWLGRVERTRTGDIPIRILHADEGGSVYYYGAAGSWGTLEHLASGKLACKPARRDGAPAWVAATNFNQILPVEDGAYFAGSSGVVHWSRRTDTCTFNEIDCTALFRVGNKVHLYSRTRHLVTPAGGTLEAVPTTGVAFASGEAVIRAAPLDENRVLLATSYKRLLVFDGRNLSLWQHQIQDALSENISDLEHLADGSIAVAIRGSGLYILSAGGELLSSLTSHEYNNIGDIAAREPGILWISTDRGIEKIYHRSPVTIFDQRVGVPGAWPKVIRWDGKTLISSGGILYENIQPREGVTARFKPIADIPSGGVWAGETVGPWLFLGNSQGVYVLREGQPLQHLIRGIAIGGLAAIGKDTCVAVGEKQIVILRFDGAQWIPDATPLEGFGYPYVLHTVGNTVWLELGVNRVARITLKDGRPSCRLFDQFPWQDSSWINIGTVGDTVVLSGPEKQRLFFSEATGDFCEAAALRDMLDRAPYWITRVVEDGAGTLWCSHEQGVVRFLKTKDGYTLDTNTCDIVRDWHPFIQVIDGDDIWLSTNTVLYHVDSTPEPRPLAPLKPVLVSVHDNRTGAQVISSRPSGMPRLPYSSNSLGLRFFAGTYGLRTPGYEFRIDPRSAGWSTIGSDSLLTLPNLREGTYAVEVRLTDTRGAVGAPATFRFEIAPPWFRTWYMFSLYGVASIAAMAGLVLWFGKRAERRNLALEKLVTERTEALRSAMERLAEETRNAATLAERDRLAQEIHDSVQQGLSGLMLQLDSTLKNPALSPDVRARLEMARKMVLFTREEVRHAVSDIESPLLENTDLGDALAKMRLAVGASTAPIEIHITGTPRPLDQSTKHHLLRIAQEAMTNAVRHSGATRIHVSLDYAPESVSISVLDDGTGFDPASLPANSIGHFGLRSIRGRTSKIGGDLKILSQTGKGTTLIITVPLHTGLSSTSHASDDKR